MEKWRKDLLIRNNRADEFLDTLKMCKENSRLSESVKKSVNEQVIIPDETIFNVYAGIIKGEVKVTANTVFEAAAAYKGKRIAVLNFASFLEPGGSASSIYKGRSNSQEASLCRTSTLYPCISDEHCMLEFYKRHASCETDLYNADLIYTPDVTVFKTATGTISELMPESDWFQVDVISMAAPNANSLNKRVYQKREDEFKDIFDIRFSRVMAIAALRGVEVLILGAFGCGEFNNDPGVVAVGAARALEKFRTAFEMVEFAVKNKNNVRVFRLVLDRYLSSQ